MCFPISSPVCSLLSILLPFLFLLYQSLPYDTTTLANTSLVATKFIKRKHLKCPPKRALLSKSKSEHQTSLVMANTNHSEAVDGAHITDESRQAAEGVASSVISEEQCEGGDKQADLETRDKSSSLKPHRAGEDAEQVNVSAEETEMDQERGLTKETQERHKHLYDGGCENDEEGSRPEPPPGSHSDSEVAAKPLQNTDHADAEIEVVEDGASGRHQSDQERTDLAPEFCAVPQVCHFSSPIVRFSSLLFLCEGDPD